MREAWQCAHHADCGEPLYTVIPVPLCEAHSTELNRARPVIGISTLPTLDQLAADASAAIGLAPSALAALQTRAAAALFAIGAALASSSQDGTIQQADDRLLMIDEAAAKLGMTKDSLYRASKTLPFAVRLGPGQLRFSSGGIDQYIQAKMARNR